MAAGRIPETLILERVNDAVIVTDMHLQVRVWNRAAESIYGWRVEEIVGRSARDVLPMMYSPDRTAIEDVRSLLQPAGHWHGPVIQVHHDGYEMIIDALVWLLHDQSGGLSGVMSINRDITKEERFHALIQNSTDVIGVLDWDGRICYISPAIEPILGSPPDALVGMDAVELVHPDDVPCVRSAIRALRSPGAVRTVSFRARNQDGTWHHYEAVSRNQGDHPPVGGIVINFRDITAREQVKTALRTSEARFRAIFEAAAIGIALANMTGRIVESNVVFQQLLGYRADELHGMVFTELTHPKDVPAEQALYQELLAGQRDHIQIEKRYRCKDGRIIWGRLVVSLVRNAAGTPQFAIGMVEDITVQKEAQEQMQHQALHDALTGLANRALFLRRLEQVLAHAKRRPAYAFAVLFLDLDRFKTINDSLGHLIGDQLLIEIAHRLATILRPEDTLARLGGDEFVILLEDLTSVSDATHVADRIQQALTTSFHSHGHEIVTSTSIGIVLNTPRYAQPEELLRDANIALYGAKAAGRGRYALFDTTMHAHAMTRLQQEAALRRAIERDELVLHYQPIVALANTIISGVEALVRWQHPTRGLIGPAEFIPLAEETGLIVPLGEWVLRTACAQTKSWHDAGVAALTVAVNLSAYQFRATCVRTMVADILAETRLDPQFITLELTESSVLEQAAATIRLLGDLRALGVQLALDDFGTGYSSLSYLKRLPLTAVKLDRSFVREIPSNPPDAAIATATIALAHTLTLQVTVEGIETEDQLRFFQAQQADAVQGYLCGHPMPADQLVPRLHEGLNFAPPVRERTAS